MCLVNKLLNHVTIKLHRDISSYPSDTDFRIRFKRIGDVDLFLKKCDVSLVERRDGVIIDVIYVNANCISWMLSIIAPCISLSFHQYGFSKLERPC